MEEPNLRSAMFAEVQSGVRKRKAIVWTTANLLGVMIVLAIIVPETHWANLIFATTMSRDPQISRSATKAPLHRPDIDCVRQFALGMLQSNRSLRAGRRAYFSS